MAADEGAIPTSHLWRHPRSPGARRRRSLRWPHPAHIASVPGEGDKNEPAQPRPRRTEPALLEHTIGEALLRAAKRWPKQEALVSVHQGIRWTYEEFAFQVDRIAAGLLALGLKPGDRVGVWAPNCAEWTLAQFATARVGLIQVNINPAYRLSEVEYTLNKVGVKALICAESVQDARLCRHDQGTLRRRSQPRTPGAARGRNASRDLRAVDPDRRRRPARLAAPSTTSPSRRRRRCARESTSIADDARPQRRRSTSSSPAAPRACRRARRSPTATSSTTPTSSASAWG